MTEIRPHASAIAPGTRDDLVEWKARFGQKILQAGFSPTGAIVGNRVIFYQKRRSHKKITTGRQHGMNIPGRSVGPQKMLEHLIGNDQIDICLNDIGAYIVGGIIHFLEAAKR